MTEYGCNNGKTHAEAQAICKNKGLNLCSEGQLLADVTAGTGCDYDEKQVWTSTCSLSPGACKKFVVTAGAKDRLPENGKEDRDATQTAAVRCCKGASTTQKARVQMTEYGCNNGKTHAEAQAICKNKGLNLCSEGQLLADVTAGTGCDYDEKQVWTSTCSNR